MKYLKLLYQKALTIKNQCLIAAFLKFITQFYQFSCILICNFLRNNSIFTIFYISKLLRLKFCSIANTFRNALVQILEISGSKYHSISLYILLNLLKILIHIVKLLSWLEYFLFMKNSFDSLLGTIIQYKSFQSTLLYYFPE